jgi:hypothetical protein
MGQVMRIAVVLLIAAGTAIVGNPRFGTLGQDPAVRKPSVNVKKDRVEFLMNEKVMANYHTGPEVAKPYLWPILGPDNVPRTRAWPMVKGQPGESADHPHQKSAWFCHGDVIPEGVALGRAIKGVEGVDFWSEQPGHGIIRCIGVDEPNGGDESAGVTTRNEWLTGDGVKIMDEVRQLTVHDWGAVRLIVVTIDLHASVCPITFGDTKEGCFGIRVNDAIREKGSRGRIENADGKVGELACWGQKSSWCDYSGPVDGKTVGIAVFDDPANPYPACWHVRGYGLMAANPFGRAKSGFPAMKGRTDTVKLAKGEHLKLRYGVLLHPGDARDGKVGEYYQRFARLRAPDAPSR